MVFERESFWAGVLSGVVTWVLGSVIWAMFFEPLLKRKGYLG